MRFGLMIEGQQGLSYAEQLAVAQRAEAAGFEAFYRSDHFDSFPGRDGLPTTDAWTVLAGLARETTTIRLGTLASPVTFRLPGVFAKLVATMDEMSGGRIDVAVGAGWHESEHARLGIPYPSIDERAQMLEEQLAILIGLWTGPDGWSFEGAHGVVRDALFRPKPVQRPRPPIIIGGEGSPRSVRIAVEYADEFNLARSGPERAAHWFGRLDQACAAAGRDPATIVKSVLVRTLVGAGAAEVDRRKIALLEMLTAEQVADELSPANATRWIMGTVEEARDTVELFARAGCQRIIFQDYLPRDLEMVDLLGRAFAAAGRA
ncbi:MAG TPA: TIGR03560 family F420-dependent LLM class oxidoreductase [Candidatus Limnocylindrales bacterium]|nr:TIGR03560 family F420-dependent LLM class oxidoreductase [Candidatus Limnocylindrales bacterium]